MFTFDLNTYFLHNQSKTLSDDVGGAIYIKKGKPYLQTIRDTIGFRPWNSKKENNFSTIE
jgi:hypothetical protein